MIRVQRILCPVDFSPASQSAVAYAAALAGSYESSLKLVNVVSPIAPVPHNFPLATQDITEVLKQNSERQLADMAARLTKSGVTVESDVMVGEVNTEIKRAISAYKPDLVAMGTHGRSGIQRWFIGSTTERLLRHCPVPLITTSMIRKPRPDATRFQRILVTTDFSDGTADALDYAFSIAQENQSAITLLHVIEAPPKSTVPNRKSLVSATLRNLAKLVPPESEAWCDVKTKAEMGTPYQVVLKVLQAGKFDLLVMNIHGKGMLERALLGSTAERVVRAARCPVMLIPPMRKTARRPRTRKTGA